MSKAYIITDMLAMLELRIAEEKGWKGFSGVHNIPNIFGEVLSHYAK